MAQRLLVTGGEKNPSKIRKYRIFLKKNKQTVLVSFCFYHFLIPFRNTHTETHVWAVCSQFLGTGVDISKQSKLTSELQVFYSQICVHESTVGQTWWRAETLQWRQVSGATDWKHTMEGSVVFTVFTVKTLFTFSVLICLKWWQHMLYLTGNLIH